MRIASAGSKDVFSFHANIIIYNNIKTVEWNKLFLGNHSDLNYSLILRLEICLVSNVSLWDLVEPAITEYKIRIY